MAEASKDTLVCRCYLVTEAAIRAAIREFGLKTVEEITARTDAAGGCGSCYEDVQAVLDGRPGPESRPGPTRQRVVEILDRILRGILEANDVQVHIVDVDGPRVLVRILDPGGDTSRPSMLALKRHVVEILTAECGEPIALVELNQIERWEGTGR